LVFAGLLAVIGDQPCAGARVSTAHIEIICNAPKMIGNNVTVKVSRLSQSGSFGALSFRGPFFTAGSIRTTTGLESTTVNGTTVSGQSTLGGDIVSMRGGLFLFANNVTAFYARYGPASNPLKYECTILFVNDTYFSCRTQAGVGRVLVFVVEASGVSSLSSIDTFSYPTPIITDGTLQAWTIDGFATGLPSTSLVGSKTADDLLIFRGRNFGNTPSDISVTYTRAEFVRTCTVKSQWTNDTRIVCATTAGSDDNWVFTVTVSPGTASGDSVTGHDYFSYPQSPTVSKVQYTQSGIEVGCTNTALGVINCPTTGGVTVTITGTKFAIDGGARAYIGSRLCPTVSLTTTEIKCSLPAGTGMDQVVVVKQGAFFSDPTNADLVSYKIPFVNQIFGCDLNEAPIAQEVHGCRREGGDLITLIGSNFGYSNARVFISGVLCTNVTHISPNVHSRITCVTPAGTGDRRLVVLFQDKGEPTSQSSTFVYLYYAPCPRGTYAAGISCPLCVAGRYTPEEGRPSCINCPIGRYAALNGSTDCTDCPAGRATAIPSTALCQACAPGSFLSDTRGTTCRSCAAGYFTSASGRTNCDPCLPGNYAPSSNSSFCFACGAGEFNPADGQATCQPCPEGSVPSVLNGASNCVGCTPGRYASVAGSSSCTPCDPGTFSSSGQSTCQQCAVGRYATLPEHEMCQPCLSGKFMNITGGQECYLCPVGRVSVSTSQITGPIVCSAVPAGNYMPSTGQTGPIACSIATYQSLPGQTACILCGNGTATGQTGSAICLPCPTGRFVDYEGAAECFRCPAGRSRTYKSNPLLATACDVCAPGTFAAQDGMETCSICSQGTYTDVAGAVVPSLCNPGRFSLPRATYCSNCTEGTITAVAGASECSPCARGEYQPHPGSSVCDLCAPGRFQNFEGQFQCNDCAIGKYSASSGNILCSLCITGQYANSTAQTECNLCAAGSYSASGVSICISCSPGSYSVSPGQAGCLLCPRTTASNITGLSTACPPCALGRYQNSEGALDCIDCPAGQADTRPGVTADSGLSECTDCKAGTYSEFAVSRDCIECGPGRFSSSTASTACTDCAPGTVIDQPGQGSCVPCESGKYYPVGGGFNCTQCAAGFVQSNTGQTACYGCTPGRFMAVPGSASCSACPVGTYQPLHNQTFCDVCIAGSFSATVSGATACTPCEQGTFVATNTSAGCFTCPTGSFNTGPGQTFCTACDRGYFSATTGAPCEACPAGRIAPTSSGSGCAACPSGTFNNQTGQYACNACPPGRSLSSDLGHTACDVCQPGTYSASTFSTVCVSSPKGSFISGFEAQRPTQCEPGTFSAQPAAIECTKCEQGRHASTVGQTNCVDCIIGFYAPVNGSSRCIGCPIGRLGDRPRASACFDCAPGFYNNYEGQTLCVACSVGDFQNDTGSSQCQTCPPGFYTSKISSTECTECVPGKAKESTQTTCEACAAGTFSASASHCEQCQIGRYQAEVGGSSCDPCPIGHFMSALGATACGKCLRRSAQPEPGKAECLPCSQNADSSPEAETCVCVEGYYLVGASNTSIDCAKCPIGAKCTTPGLTLETMTTLSGYWRAQNDSLFFYRCLLPAHCASGVAAACNGHRTGPLCAVCIEGYRAQSGLGICQKCPETRARGLTLSVFLCIFVVIVIIALYWGVLRADKQIIDYLTELDRRLVEWDKEDLNANQLHSRYLADMNKIRRRPNITFKIKIIIGFFQIVTNMAFVLDVKWPATYETFLSYFSFMNLDFVPWQSVGCVASYDYYIKVLSAARSVPQIYCLC
jgi:hypothetical protein